MNKSLPPMSEADAAQVKQALSAIRGREGHLLITDQQNHHDDDYEFVGYISWIEECGLFFVALAACGSLIWLGWHTGKAMGFWS